ncbi:MAG TPA: hypothetical protein VE914_00630 [Candidatus Angelobacter sp.]|nr:hypothetical protein [Candidatus Angelobacter sp.]
MNADKVVWDLNHAAFDRLRLRCFLRAMNVVPHPELVEGRTALAQRSNHRRSSAFIGGFNIS